MGINYPLETAKSPLNSDNNHNGIIISAEKLPFHYYEDPAKIMAK